MMGGAYLEIFDVNVDRMLCVDLQIFDFVPALKYWLKMIVVIIVEEDSIFEG
jgi:hypothetical protein